MGMDNESKKPQRTTSGRRADTAWNLVTNRKPTAHTIKSLEAAHRNTNLSSRAGGVIACARPLPDHREERD